MASSFSKMKKKHANIEHMYGSKLLTPSNNQYLPYHRRLQKKQHLIDNDHQFILLDAGHDEPETKEFGINTNSYSLNSDFDINEWKDGTE